MGRAAGPAAEPPTRAKPVCFDAVETACGRKAAVCRNLRGAPAGAFVKKIAGGCGGGVKKIVITSGGESLLQILIGTPARRGPTFVRTKVGKIRLGRCPKTPIAGCAGYGLIFDGSPKSIRTAHRIAPKVAAAHLPFPPTPFPDGGKGARMGGRNQGNSLTLGVLGLAKTASR